MFVNWDNIYLLGKEKLELRKGESKIKICKDQLIIELKLFARTFN